ncbi:hypothetical protein ACH46N_15035 [Streptomyces pristinaespiralis]|nr:hypothetical protein [Streptomyces pristinaespiralis]ALC20364.1 hypothetical protein SPRI_2058 [Streptomyces pristinaespiralis]QMU16770.1 hypothetical protein H3L99_26730 [Streptomyces pristinaespiralis]
MVTTSNAPESSGTDNPTQTTSSGGTVQFLTVSEAVGKQANKDVANLVSNSKEAVQPEGAITAAGIGAAASVGLLVSSAVQSGVAVANMVTADDSVGQLEISVSNESSHPVTLYNYESTSCEVSDLPNPLAPGASDVAVLTKDAAFGNGDGVRLDFCVGSDNPINFSLWYNYRVSSAQRWILAADVDDADTTYPMKKTYDAARQMFGLTFTPPAGGTQPRFSVYTSPIESGSGHLSVAVYDLAP